MSYLYPYYERSGNKSTLIPYSNDFDPEEEDENLNDDYFDQRINEIISNTMGENIPNDKKERLLESISFILQKNENKLLSYLKAKNYNFKEYPSPRNSTPHINIVLFPSPMTNTATIPTNGYPYYQPQIPFNPNCMPLQMQAIPSPYMNYNQAAVQHYQEEEKNKKKKKSDKKDKKKKKSDKKDKKKKDKKKAKKDKESDSSISLLYKKGQDFDGILNYLTKKTGDNIQNNGTIEVTSNSSNCKLQNLLEFNERNMFQAKRDNDVWICYDFKQRRVKINGYQIKSFQKGKNGPHLKSWCIETSNDNNVWTKIDERFNCDTLNGSLVTGTFDARPNEFVRYVRLHQTDKTWQGSGIWLVFYYLEFYGFLKEDN